MDEFISHYGIKRRSGRYPWGSGENPYQGDGIKKPNKKTYLDDGRSVKDVLKEAKKQISFKKLAEAKSEYIKILKSLKIDPESPPSKKMAAYNAAAASSAIRNMQMYQIQQQNMAFMNYAMTGAFF